jgi:mannose-6-phosphate isomerase
LALAPNEIEETKPYAELWFGSHPSGPSKVVSSRENFTSPLSFLLKVLSVGKALSIQAHPDKKLAEQVHRERPDLYKDDNHKPEMAIALTDFEALVGFRPIEEINRYLEEVSALRELTGWTKLTGKSDLKEFFASLMKAEKVTEAFELVKENKSGLSNLKDLFLKLASQYPVDIGCFCIFVLNYVKLRPGDAIFLGPNFPHAYLSGDCVECMANSDNVVRAGLTPKYRDVDLLVKMLNYEPTTPDKLLLKGHPIDKHCTLYDSPVEEFAVNRYTLKSGQILDITNSKNSIFLIIDGQGTFQEHSFESGSAFYAAPNSTVAIQASSDLLFFKAFSKITKQ